MDTSSNKRLFTACFVALMATSFIFMFRAMFITEWGIEFDLSETQKGEILGVGLWPFALSIVLFSLIVDKIGYGKVLGFAFLAHVISILLIVFANGFSMLYAGTFILALGNGAVESAINPIITTMYPKEKIKRLSFLHAAWPGGMLVAGLLGIFLGSGIVWQIKYSLVFIPVGLYGFLLLHQRFPVQERVLAGVTFKEMFKELGFVGVSIIVYLIISQLSDVFGFSASAKYILLSVTISVAVYWIRSFGKPLFLILMLIMIPLATTELGTDSWIIDLMSPEIERIGLNRAWILIYTAILMTLVRLLAGKFMKRISPFLLLALASGISAVGLFGLSLAEGLLIIMATTVFGIAKAFFWPTMLGIVSEQFPRGGALTLNVIAGTGMIGTGIIGTVLLGFVQDTSFDKNLLKYDRENFTQLHEKYVTIEKESAFGIYKMLDSKAVFDATEKEKTTIHEMQLFSKKTALKYVAILPIITMISYLLLELWFKRLGGYQSVIIDSNTIEK